MVVVTSDPGRQLFEIPSLRGTSDREDQKQKGAQIGLGEWLPQEWPRLPKNIGLYAIKTAGKPERDTSGDERIGYWIGQFLVEDQIHYRRICVGRLAGVQCLCHRSNWTQDLTSQSFQHFLTETAIKKSSSITRTFGRAISIPPAKQAGAISLDPVVGCLKQCTNDQANYHDRSVGPTSNDTSLPFCNPFRSDLPNGPG